MPNLMNMIDAKSRPEPGKGIESFFTVKKSDEDVYGNSTFADALQKAVKSNDGKESLGWRINEVTISTATIKLRNRAQQQESLKGWRMGSDGVRTYSTYRNGKLVTASGAEAMRLSMGDQKTAKRKKSDLQEREKDTQGEEKEREKEKEKEKENENEKEKEKEKGVKPKKQKIDMKKIPEKLKIRKEVAKSVLSENTAVVVVVPRPYNRPTSTGVSPLISSTSADQNEVDWGF